MKPASGNSPRLLAPPKKQVRLDLRRSPAREPEGKLETEPTSSFWKWVGLVTLFHLVLIGLVCWFYETTKQPPPKEPFTFSLLPPGDTVKGTIGTQSAPHVGITTPAPSVQHPAPPHVPAPPKPPTPVAIQPPTPPPPTPVAPTPAIHPQATPLPPIKPVAVKPIKPKITLNPADLTVANAPPTPAKHLAKPKPPQKQTTPADTTSATNPTNDSTPDNNGLSKAEIAAKLGSKLQAAGVTNSVKIGASGSDHSEASSFAEFYVSVHDQVFEKWQEPNLTEETAVSPEVVIHVEKDGRVPPELVTLSKSSGNQAFDDSAVAAAKSLGHLLQPLPDGCPPDIYITFNLTR